MKIRIFNQLDPRENRLPADTSRFIPDKRPRRVPFVRPEMFVQNNPAIQRLLAPLDPVNPMQIRADLKARLQRQVTEVNRQIQASRQFRGIRFEVDQASGRAVALVRDTRSGQVLKQIPAEQMLEMAARLKEASGLLQDVTV